jgi:hypothetical protein
VAKKDDRAEFQRLTAARETKTPWRKWGPYLSERQWGTVREDFSAEGASHQTGWTGLAARLLQKDLGLPARFMAGVPGAKSKRPQDARPSMMAVPPQKTIRNGTTN